MKKTLLLFISLLFLNSCEYIPQAGTSINEIGIESSYGFDISLDQAQYGGGDWNGLLYVKKGLTRSEALRIAQNDSNVTFFFYTKGGRMVLNTPKGTKVFEHKDVAFFKGKPATGSALGLADTYIRK